MTSQRPLFLLSPLGPLPSKIYITLPFCCCLYVCPDALAKPFGSPHPQRQPMIHYISETGKILNLLSDDFILYKIYESRDKEHVEQSNLVKSFHSAKDLEKICPNKGQKSQSDSNVLPQDYLIANSEIITPIPGSVFELKQFRENGIKVLRLMVCFFNHNSQTWKGQNWSLEDENWIPNDKDKSTTAVRATPGAQVSLGENPVAPSLQCLSGFPGRRGQGTCPEPLNNEAQFCESLNFLRGG